MHREPMESVRPLPGARARRFARPAGAEGELCFQESVFSLPLKLDIISRWCPGKGSPAADKTVGFSGSHGWS